MKKSNLYLHAQKELNLAGLFGEESDYGGELGKAIMRIVEVFSEQDFSGASADMAIQILNKLLKFKTLTPITSDPNEWIDRTEESGKPMWQSMRDPAIFSTDGGKTWYNIDSLTATN